MHIKYQIERFRSIVEQQEVILDSNKINIIVGKNGSGKSNFLEAISWFSGGKINNPKNLRTRKTEFHPNFNGINNAFLDEPEIIYDDELSKSEEEKIFSYLDSIGINLEIKKLTRHFSKYKDLFYKDLYINKNDLTHLSIIQKKYF